MVGTGWRDNQGEGEGREGEGGEAQSDAGAGLLCREVTQNCVYEILQVQTGHRTRQLLHIICMDRGQDVINNTHGSDYRV